MITCGSPLILRQQAHGHVLHSIAQCAGTAGMVLLYGLLTGCGSASEVRRARSILAAIAAPKVYEGSCKAASSAFIPSPAAYPDLTYTFRLPQCRALHNLCHRDLMINVEGTRNLVQLFAGWISFAEKRGSQELL